MPTRLTLWAGGFQVSPLVAASGLAVDAAGRAVTDRMQRGEEASRQLASRARRRLQERRPRFADAPQRREALVERFLDACERGARPNAISPVASDSARASSDRRSLLHAKSTRARWLPSEVPSTSSSTC